jgi:hypothetical protein
MTVSIVALTQLLAFLQAIPPETAKALGLDRDKGRRKKRMEGARNRVPAGSSKECPSNPKTHPAYLDIHGQSVKLSLFWFRLDLSLGPMISS